MLFEGKKKKKTVLLKMPKPRRPFPQRRMLVGKPVSHALLLDARRMNFSMGFRGGQRKRSSLPSALSRPADSDTQGQFLWHFCAFAPSRSLIDIIRIFCFTVCTWAKVIFGLVIYSFLNLLVIINIISIFSILLSTLFLWT